MDNHVCGECSRSLASPQSLWNHKQRCKVRRDLKAAGREGVKIAKDVGKEVGKEVVKT